MPNFYRYLYSLLAIVFLPLNGCQKGKADIDPTPSQPVKITFYTNQTGNPAAEGLQVQVLDPNKKVLVNVYGTFDADQKPLSARSLTLQKTGNDTTVHMLLNALTHQLQTLYMDVKGIKQPIVLKVTPVPADVTSERIGLYIYDWQTNRGVLKSEAVYRRPNTTATPTFAANRITGLENWTDTFKTGVASMALTEAALFLLQGEGFLITAAVIAAVAPAAAAVATFALNVALMAWIMDMVVTEAKAAEPENIPYPANTPAQHSSAVPAASSLPASSCDGTSITFKAGMDSQGSILIYGVAGSPGPFTYSVNKLPYQTSELFAGSYPDNSYVISVRNAAGCVGAALIALKRNIACNIPAERMLLLSGGSIKTWRLISANGKTATTQPNRPIRYIVSADGQLSYDGYFSSTQNPSILEPTSLIAGGSICPTGSDSEISYFGPGTSGTIVELTATRLVIKSVRTNPIENYTFVAP